MAEALQSSVVVEFVPNENQGSLKWEQDNERATVDDSQTYLRLYPAHPEKLIVTSGNLSKSGIDYKKHEEILVFQKTQEVSLTYAEVTSVNVEPIGTFYDTEGAAFPVNVWFDSTRNVIRADRECYGVVRVRYSAPYQLYLFTFSGTPCDMQIVDGKLEVIGGYSDSTIIAINFTEQTSSSINVTPAECGDFELSVTRAQEAALPRLRLEIHKDYPPRLTGVDGKDEVLTAGCKVRQIPAVPATVQISSGSFNPFGEIYTEEVVDVQTFNGSASINMQYQPIGSLSLSKVSPFWNRWGDTVSPEFARPGDTVTEVDWINAYTYTNPRPRVVREDEIVAVGSGGKTIEVFGVIRVSYSINYKMYDVRFSMTDVNYPENGWDTVYMVAFYEDQSDFLQVNPPSMKGV